MVRFYMKEVTRTYHRIDLARQKVGFVRKNDNGVWVAILKKHGRAFRAESSVAKVAFGKVVRLSNRVAIAGTTDFATVQAVITKKNADLENEVLEVNRLLDGTGARWTISRRKVNV